MCMNHPEAIPPSQSVKKLSSMKLVPGAKKVGDHCSKPPPGAPVAHHFFTGRPVTFGSSCWSITFNLPGRQFPNEMPVSPGNVNWQNLAYV